MIKYEYEQYKPFRQIWAWLTVFGLSAITLTWGMVGHHLVREGPRHWDYGTHPDTPGLSVFTTQPPPQVEVAPPQIELPSGRAVEDEQGPENQ